MYNQCDLPVKVQVLNLQSEKGRPNYGCWSIGILNGGRVIRRGKWKGKTPMGVGSMVFTVSPPVSRSQNQVKR